MVVRVAVFLILLVAAIAAGLYLGGQSANPPVTTEQLIAEEDAPKTVDETKAPEAPPKPDQPKQEGFTPPLYFYADLRAPNDLPSVRQEITMAQEAGVTAFIVPVDLDWSQNGNADTKTLEALREIAPDTPCFLHINLNPPTNWLANHPDGQVQTEAGALAYASPDYEPWRDEATAALQALLTEIHQNESQETIPGYLISALQQGYWYIPDGDRSNATASGFQQWVVDRYETDEQLQSAWHDDDATLDAATLPESEIEESTAMFFDPESQQNQIDYAKYLSERTARTIAHFASVIKNTAGTDFKVIVPYGFLFELPSAQSGHAALERVLASPVDGIASPVSLASRAIGETGGYMGPVNTAKHAAKEWLILDDTRTGLAGGGRGADTSGVPMADIYNVLERNFAAALSHELALAWCDFSGQGQHNDRGMWDVFRSFQHVYRNSHTHGQALAGQYRIYDVRPEGVTTLAVVIDEESTFYEKRDDALNLKTMLEVRDAALKSGVPVQFVLLSDVLADKAPPAQVYIFANIWKLNTRDREQLHAILAREQATAVWLYAAGYFDETGTAENVAATTKMNVKAFEEPTVSGSHYALNGSWIRRGETIGDPVEWDPLLHVEIDESDNDETTNDENDNEVDGRYSVLARYGSTEEGRVSMASYYTEEEWTSIFIAEPNLTPRLVREILRMLELNVFAAPDNRDVLDTYYFTNNLVAIHAQKAGERILPFAWEYDVLEALQSAQADLGIISETDIIGWTGKRSITIQMDMGETRLFRLTPIAPNAQ